MVRQRVRIRFSKRGDLRLVGHRDMVRSMERLFRRAGLQLGMSQGFHPKPRMSFPSALALGIEGLDEPMELELARPYTADELLARLVQHRVPGLGFQSVEVLSPGAKKARVRSLSYEVAVPPDRRAPAADRLAGLMASRTYPIQRPNRSAPVDLRQSLQALTLIEGVLCVRLGIGPGASAGPRDALAALDLGDLEQEGFRLRRTAVELQ